MNRDEYVSYFKLKNNIIILPYSDPSYNTNIRYILEAISLGKIVFVSSNTLIADELNRFNLHDLIVKDWSDPKLLNKINDVFLIRKLQNICIK